MKRLVVLLLGILVLAGCGGKLNSNPTAGYNVKAVKPTGQVQDTQMTPVSAFAIDVVANTSSSSDVSFPTSFVEGQEGKLIFRVRNLQRATIQGYSLQVSKFPNNDTKNAHLESIGNDEFVFHWTPSVGTIGNGLPDQSEQLQVVALPSNFSNSYWANKPTFKDVVLTVSHDQTRPQILGINHLPTSITEGDAAVPFSIDVLDSSHSGKAPVVYATSYDTPRTDDNHENFKGNGGAYVIPDPNEAPTQSGNKWTLHYLVYVVPGHAEKMKSNEVSVDQNGQKDRQGDFMNAWFTLKAFNGFGSESKLENHQIRINYAVQAPDVDWNGVFTNFSEVKVGQPDSFKFKASVGNKRGAADVVMATKGFENWPGRPKMDCVNTKGDVTSKECTVTFNVTCDEKVPATKNLSLNLVGHFADKGDKTKSLVREIHFVKDDSTCAQAPAATTATDSKDSKAAPKTVKTAKTSKKQVSPVISQGDVK